MNDRLVAPSGYKPGDVPAGIEWGSIAYVILPAEASDHQKQTRKAVVTALKRTEIDTQYMKIRQVIGHGGHKFNLLYREDVATLYRTAHRKRVAVFALGGAKVLLDISEMPSNAGCISLEEFIRYKCSYALVTRPAEAEQFIDSAIAWMNATHCGGARDPRCLPATIFESGDSFDLDTAEGRDGFNELHRRAKHSTAMIDAKQREWERGPPHSRELLQVAGQTLPVGFHWDVQSKHESVIANGWERWRLPGNSYTNVHPDAYVRAGNATKTHPSDTLGKPPRTPRSVRRGHSRRKNTR